MGMTLGQITDDYLLRLRNRDCTEASFKFALHHVRAIHGYFGWGYEADRLCPISMDKLIAHRLGGGRRVSTVNGTLRVFKAALLYAVENGKIESFPKIKLLREPRRLPSVMTRQQIDELLEIVGDHPIAHLAIVLAADSGLRRGEIQHLTLKDLLGRTVKVRAKGDWRPKSHHEREIPLTERARKAVRRFALITLYPVRCSHPHYHLHTQ